jgi:hypothetical protein
MAQGGRNYGNAEDAEFAHIKSVIKGNSGSEDLYVDGQVRGASSWRAIV